MTKLNNKRLTTLNAIASLLLQVATIISSFVIPRLTLKVFGSEVNGLVSSLNQFLHYVTILEGGVSAVIMANLYKPLLSKDSAKISSIVVATKKFFKTLALIFAGYALLVALFYQPIMNTSFSYQFIFSLTLILAVTIFIQYNFSLTWRLLLQADKKVYIAAFVQILFILINTASFALAINIWPNIHILKLISAAFFVLQPIAYNYFVKKYFKLDLSIKPNKNLLKSRWDGFSINIAAFVHHNTDITLLTMFTSLKTVSVYAVYNLVTSGLRKIIQSVSSGILPSLGHVYAEGDEKKLLSTIYHYEYVIFFLVTMFFTVGGLLITPFVQLYTTNVTDTNYYQPIFGLLLVLSEAVYCLRDPFVNLAYSANKFKEIKFHAYFEAILNIGISIILVAVFRLGLIGVAIGTLSAMTYRTIFHIIYTRKLLPTYTYKHFFKVLSIFLITATISVLMACLAPIGNTTILSWIGHAIIYSGITLLLLLINSRLFLKDEFNYLFGSLVKKFKR